jgi:uncharacterized protein YxeA
MKLKFYSVLISAFLLISFSSYADADAKAVKSEKADKKKSESVSEKKSAEYFSFKSSSYDKNGRVKRKGSKKSCPAFEL